MTTEDRDDRGLSDARTSPESFASPSSDLSPLVRDVPPPMSASGISKADLRAYLGRAEVQKRIRAIVVKRVRSGSPDAIRDDIVQQANEALLRSTSRPRSIDTVPGWVSTVTVRTIASYFRAEAARRRWLADADPEDVADETAVDPAAIADGDWMIAPWLAHAVAPNPRDQETYELLAYKAATRKSYAEVAVEHAITEQALRARVGHFKRRYLPRYRRRRTNLALAIVTGAFTLALLGWLFWYPKPEMAKPPPDKPAPSSSPSIPPPVAPAPVAPPPVAPAPGAPPENQQLDWK